MKDIIESLARSTGKTVEELFSWMLERHLSLEQANLDQLQNSVVKKSNITWQGWKHE
jgi:hypothetical protein